MFCIVSNHGAITKVKMFYIVSNHGAITKDNMFYIVSNHGAIPKDKMFYIVSNHSAITKDKMHIEKTNQINRNVWSTDLPHTANPYSKGTCLEPIYRADYTLKGTEPNSKRGPKKKGN